MKDILLPGGFIMRRFGTLGLLTGTQVFGPSQFREKVRKMKQNMKDVRLTHINSSGSQARPSPRV